MYHVRSDYALSASDVETLVRAHGTPLYIFDTRAAAARLQRLRRALPVNTGICYAMKANTFVLPDLAPLVDRIEVCSPGELRICRTLGIPSGKLVISGVYKDEETVSDVLSRDEPPAAVTIESRSQLELVGRIAAARDVRVPVLLRVTSGNQFGIDADEVRAIVSRGTTSWLEVRGIQFFSGTQKTSLKRVAREIALIDELVGDLNRAHPGAIAEVEYGPGLPVSYFANDDFDEDAYLATLSGLLADMAFAGRITIEIGRSLVASAGTYLTRVVDTKVSCGQRYAIVDGGMHQMAYYGQSMAMRQPHVRVLGTGGTRHPEDGSEPLWTICGALCTVNDVIVKQMPLAGLTLGSLLAFADVGAYSATEGIALFLSRDLPRVALVGLDGTVQLVRGGLRTDPLNTPFVDLR